MSQQPKGAISESTIARMAGNIMAGFKSLPTPSERDIADAVGIARAIAAEAERTKPKEEPSR